MSRGNLQRLVRREIKNMQENIVGTVISELRLIDFDGNSSGVWVCDVEIGSNHYLQDIPVKALSNRFHAQLGQSVLLRKNARGRYEVIGPGDRITKPLRRIGYNLATQVAGTPIDVGFTFDRVPFSYYQTVDLTAPLDVLWGDGVTPFGLVRIVDADGNPV
jgi:hypothetical protein